MTSSGKRELGLDHMPRDFDIEFDVHDRVLKPHGELDMLTSAILLAAAKAFTQELPGDVTIDFGSVTFGELFLLSGFRASA